MVVTPTSTTLASSLNPAPFGEAVTFTATVSAGAVPVVAGTVTFTDETTATELDTITVGSNGQASITTSTLSAGSHQIIASFNGTSSFEASVSDPLIQQIDAPQADLTISKTDGVTTVTARGSVTYTLTASNAGPSDALGATVADIFPGSLTGVSWSCIGAGGGTCTAAGSGNLDDTIDLPTGGSVTYTVSATLDPSATGTLTNTATVAAPAGVTDPNPADNSATDADNVTPPSSTSTTTTTAPTTTTTAPSTTTTAPTTTTTAPTTTTTTTAPTTSTTSTTLPTTSTTSSTTTTSTLPTQVATVTALTASPNPSTLGEAVTFTATVTPADGGGPVGFRGRAAPRQVPGPDGGTLTIGDGDVVLATVAVEDGQAAFTTTSLTVGRHTITAAFSGTATAASSSVTIVQQVDVPAALPATR